MPYALTKRAVRLISDAVDRIFDRLKWRVFGPDYVPHYGDKKIYLGYRPAWSLPGIYRQAAAEEAQKPDERSIHGLVKVSESYIEAERERTKARILNAVNAWVTREPDADIATVLTSELDPIIKEMTASVVKTVDTAVTTARNMGTLDSIAKIAAAQNDEDPHVYFIVVRDKTLCEECKRVHLLPDGVTPRVFRMSEVSSGYHTRGDDTPSVSGLHPHCRCSLTAMARGYGFDRHGSIKFVSLDHNEYDRQRE